MKHSGPISTLAPAGARLLTGGYDGAVAVYDVARGAYVAMHHAHRGLVTSSAATPITAFTGGSDGRVVVAAITTDGALDLVGDVAFDDDVESLVAVSDTEAFVGLGDGTVHRLGVGDGTFDTEPLLRLTGTITALCLAPQGLLVTANDGTLRLAGDDLGLRILHRSELPMKNCCVLPGQDVVVAGGHDGALVAVSLVDFTVTELHTFATSVRALAATPDRLFVGVYDGTVHAFERPSLVHLGPVGTGAAAGEPWTRQLVAAASGEVFVAGFDGFPVEVANPDRARTASNIDRMAPGSAPGTWVLGTDGGAVVRLRSCGRLELDHLHGVGQCITTVAVHPRGDVAAATWDGTVFIDGHAVLRRPEPLLGLAFVGDDLVVGTYGGAVVRLAADGTVVDELRALPSSVKAIAPSPTGDRLFVVGRYGPMAVIDVGSWAVQGTVPLHTRVSDVVAVSPSGARMAVAAGPNEVWVFETCGIGGDAVPLHRLGGHAKPPKAVAWEGDDVLLTVGYDARLVRHDLRTGGSTMLDLGAVADQGLCGVASVGPGGAIVTAFNGLVQRVAFDV